MKFFPEIITQPHPSSICHLFIDPGHGLKDLKNAFFTPTAASLKKMPAHLKPTAVPPKGKDKKQPGSGFTYDPVAGTGHVDAPRKDVEVMSHSIFRNPSIP